MKSNRSYHGTSYMEGEGVVKKKIEQIFADDASLRIKRAYNFQEQMKAHYKKYTTQY